MGPLSKGWLASIIGISKSSFAGSKGLACEELAQALDDGSVGAIVSKHEKLILHYYADVQWQAQQSFLAAKRAAYVGFAVLIFTWLYTLGFNLFGNLPAFKSVHAVDSQLTTRVGVISGILIEFIAGVQFWLYSKASKQFGAFHICLERTHRYLVAYKIADNAGSKRETVLAKLACIMASAPMITDRDIDDSPVKKSEPQKLQPTG